MSYDYLHVDEMFGKWEVTRVPEYDGFRQVFLFPNGERVVLLRHSNTDCSDHSLFEIISAGNHWYDCNDTMAVSHLAKAASAPIQVEAGDYVVFRPNLCTGFTYGGITLLDGEMFEKIPTDRIARVDRSPLPDVFSFKDSPYFYSTEMIERNLGKLLDKTT